MPPSKVPVEPQRPGQPDRGETDPDDAQLEEPKDDAFDEDDDTSNVSMPI